MIDAAELRKRFTHHPPKDNKQVADYADIRASGKEFAEVIVALTPPSREQSLAITALEECVMWANAAIARNE